MFSIRHILLATDLSPEAMPAFEHALDLARSTGAELAILHVHDASVVTASERPEVVAVEVDRHEGAEGMLDELVRRARGAGVSAEGILHTGRPPDRILEVAEEREPDLLVLGTRGRRGIERFLLGSVAAKVLIAAPCPVLTVRYATAPSRVERKTTELAVS